MSRVPNLRRSGTASIPLAAATRVATIPRAARAARAIRAGRAAGVFEPRTRVTNGHDASTVFGRVKASMPSGPSSTPWPDCFHPPMGAR